MSVSLLVTCHQNYSLVVWESLRKLGLEAFRVVFDVVDVVLVFLFLTLNMFHIFFNVYIVDTLGKAASLPRLKRMCNTFFFFQRWLKLKILSRGEISRVTVLIVTVL